MSGSTTNLDLIVAGQAGAATAANSLFDPMSPNAFMGRRAAGCAGLTWAWYGGVANVAGVPTIIANGTRTLTANVTNYMYLDGNATAQFTTSTPTGWPGPLSGAYAGFLAMYALVCGANTVTSYTDYRLGLVGGSTPGPAGAAGAVWRTGSGVPSNGLGANGDFYIDLANGNVYMKASGTYSLQLNIQGPAWTATVGSAAYAATVTFDTSVKDIYDVTLTGNVVFAFSNGVDGKVTRIRVRQDATGGRLLTLASGVRLGTDLNSLVLSSAANKLDYIAVQYNSTNSTYDVVSFVRGF
jgi:hypothetical protein